MSLKGIGRILKGMAFLATLFVIDQWIFSKWFGLDYWRWYLTNGAIIGLVSPIVFRAWGDLADKHSGLLSPHPYVYLGSCIQVIGLPIFSLGTHLIKRKPRKLGQARAREKATTAETRPSVFDLLLTFVWLPIMLAAIAAWFVIVVPLQYVVHLVCGAPVRFILNSERLPIVRLAGSQLYAGEISRKETEPEGWESASMSKRPVSMTNILAAILFWALQSFGV